MADQKAPAPGTTKSGRKAPKKRPVFVGLQILDENGQPMQFPKERINLIIATRDAGSLLEILDGNKEEYKFATYKKVDAVE